MNYKKNLKSISVVSVLLLVVIVLLSVLLNRDVCIEYYLCEVLTGESVGMPVFFFSVLVLIFSLILRWFPDTLFHSWWRFTKYYLIIAAILIFIMPVTDASIMGIDKELMSWFTASVYFTISVILIILKWLKDRKATRA